MHADWFIDSLWSYVRSYVRSHFLLSFDYATVIFRNRKHRHYSLRFYASVRQPFSKKQQMKLLSLNESFSFSENCHQTLSDFCLTPCLPVWQIWLNCKENKKSLHRVSLHRVVVYHCIGWYHSIGSSRNDPPPALRDDDVCIPRHCINKLSKQGLSVILYTMCFFKYNIDVFSGKYREGSVHLYVSLTAWYLHTQRFVFKRLDISAWRSVCQSKKSE